MTWPYTVLNTVSIALLKYDVVFWPLSTSKVEYCLEELKAGPSAHGVRELVSLELSGVSTDKRKLC